MSWIDNVGQMSALADLKEVIRRGLQAELEPLVWVVGFTGVTGKVENISQPTAAAVTVFESWAEELGAPVGPEGAPGEYSGDVVRTARARLYTGGTLIVLRLTLWGHVVDEERGIANG